MILKKYVKDIVARALSGLENKISDVVYLNKDVYALTLLKNAIPDNIYIPFTTWSMSPKAILHLYNEIIINDHKSIIEFGAGASTIYITWLIKNNNLDAKLFCVESDNDWIQKITQYLPQEHSSIVQFINAPIMEEKEFLISDKACWYSKGAIRENLNCNVSLVIVDGPPKSTCEFARYPAIPFLLKESKLSENYCVLLDDTFRPGEKVILEKWTQMLKGQAISFAEYSLIVNSNNKTFDTTPIFEA